MAYLLVAVFGALGAVSRYGLDQLISDRADGRFPWGTFTVNVVGAFLLGILIAQTTERLIENENWRIALGVGFLGAFTTFSTYAYDTVRLAEDGAVSLAVLYALGMVVLGLGAAIAGLALGRSL